MSSRFEEALRHNQVAQKLGDVELRFDAAMLIGETRKVLNSGIGPTLLQALSIVGAGIGVVGLIQTDGLTTSLFGIFLCAFGMWASTWVATRNRQRRRFIMNYGTWTLRLDFSSPIRNAPRTMNIAFENVKDLQLVPQADGRLCLLVDFVRAANAQNHFQEVLVAHIALQARPAAERLLAMLQKALFAPPDPTAVASPGPDDEVVDSFTPAAD